jgi:hypothetical protein
MKNIMSMLVFALVSMVALPSFAAGGPQSAEDCIKVHAGDQVKIQACIDGLKK